MQHPRYELAALIHAERLAEAERRRLAAEARRARRRTPEPRPSWTRILKIRNH